MMNNLLSLWLFLLAVGVWMLMPVVGQRPQGQLRPELDPRFRPILVRADFTSRQVRPGDPVGVTFTFGNEGTAPAQGNYTVFLHFEYPEPACSNIKFQFDHQPTQPTSTWQPGQKTTDGPHLVPVPAEVPEGVYHVHVGLYAPKRGGQRLLDTYAGTLTVSWQAPAVEEIGPEPLSPEEVKARRERLARRLRRPVVLEQPTFRFALDPELGAFELVDKRTGVRWTSNLEQNLFGTVELASEETERTAVLERFEAVERTPDGLHLSTPLQVDGQPTGLTLHVFIEPVSEPEGLRFRYEVKAAATSYWQVRAVKLLDRALGTTDADKGYAVVPYRLGELLSANEGLPATRSYLTYNNTSLALYGAVKQGSALLVAWAHPDTLLEVFTTWPDHPLVSGRRMLSMSLTLRGEAREFTLHPLGRGGYVEIARAYRPIARRHGWLKTWAEKRPEFPQVDQMFGAADFKPFVFSRTVPSSRFNRTGREQTHLSYTFTEAAQVAEHLHRDLQIDRAMYVLAGWIHRGYDNQHPDILPAAPECGGNERLAECARRVKACKFLFGLHDNYQDMYRDAPSWDEKYLNKTQDGRPKKGGNWAGGQAWQVCAIKQVELASRPQNLPTVKQLFGPTIYFIDTTFAWPLVTCEDPEHPMNRVDDMRWKSRLCDVAKEHFGLFGSEEGREWAVPHADYFEGLLSHKVSAGRTERGFSRTAGGVVVPLFELIYGDCLNLYTHQGDRATPSRPQYILDHVLYAENAVYAFGPHLYYTQPDVGPLPVTVAVTNFRPTGPRTFQVTYQWRVTGEVKQDYRCFVHFTHPKGERERENIAFQDDHELPRPTSTWRQGEVIVDGPRTVEVPDKYQGDVEWLIGLYKADGRAELTGLVSVNGRHHLGTLRVEGDHLTFVPSTRRANPRLLARADQGWAQGLNETDRFIKNTYEVLSWLNRITAETPMTDHRFLTPDRSVEYSAFGEVQIWVNYGPEPYVVPPPEPLQALSDQPTILPENGFLVLSPRFVALHATSFGGLTYEESVLFTARSLDDRPLWESERVRIYHGFGEPRLQLGGKEFQVEREAVVRVGE